MEDVKKKPWYKMLKSVEREVCGGGGGGGKREEKVVKKKQPLSVCWMTAAAGAAYTAADERSYLVFERN